MHNSYFVLSLNEFLSVMLETFTNLLQSEKTVLIKADIKDWILHRLAMT